MRRSKSCAWSDVERIEQRIAPCSGLYNKFYGYRSCGVAENRRERAAASRIRPRHRLLAKSTPSIVSFNSVTSTRKPDFGFSPGVPML